MGRETDYRIDSQIVVNKFVNSDYKAMSNSMTGSYIGVEEEEFETSLVYDLAKDFEEWL